METWEIKLRRKPTELGKLTPVGAPMNMITASRL
jgi:hypothetical protein